MRKHDSKFHLDQRLLAGLTLAVGLGLSVPASAVVYTASNEVTANEIIAFDVERDGTLSEIGRFDTQGAGTGTPLGNQSALATDASDRWLFAVNPGDGTLTSFRLQEKGLQFVDLEDSGGYRPISVTVFGTLVYVLNEGDGASTDPYYRYDNISGFRFTAGGLLEPIPHSTRIIDDTQLTAPAQVGFNKSGTVLLITEKATDTLTTFVMQQDGTPAATPLKRPSAVPTPFGFQFGDRDFVFITEANGGAQGVTASYRIDRETGAVSDAVGLVQQEDATCWTVLNADQTLGYSTNTASGTVSIYRIGFAGNLNPFFQRFQQNRVSSVPTGAGVRDAVLSQNNLHLFTLNNGDGELRSFNLNRRGAIRPVNAVSIPDSATGLMSR
ncbi:MAG: lactonase family protein [Thiohalocapsa sp.]|nr:lactonase family protein [Thiohalocapsa sp.]MCF7989212.1 lactonase family protein [Thiohalocapsa sp.]